MDNTYLFLIYIYIEKCTFIYQVECIELLGWKSKQILAARSFLMDTTILCLDPCRGAYVFVWTSKESKQEGYTDNLLFVFLWCHDYKDPEWPYKA